MLQIRLNITHLNTIHYWLNQEWIDTQSGFNCNWQKIKDAFKSGELFTFETNDQVLGYIVFSENETNCTIDLMEINPTERNKGIGSEFIIQAIDFFQKRGAKTIKVYCSPRSSEPFWRKFGFDNSDDPLVEFGTPLELEINANLNVNPSLASVTFS